MRVNLTEREQSVLRQGSGLPGSGRREAKEKPFRCLGNIGRASVFGLERFPEPLAVCYLVRRFDKTWIWGAFRCALRLAFTDPVARFQDFAAGGTATLIASRLHAWRY